VPDEKITVEVAYATPQEQFLLSLPARAGITVEQAIKESGVLERFPEIDLKTSKVGVFGKLAKIDAVLNDHDRVEIYRPLIADPKEARKKRAAEGKVMKKGAREKNAEAEATGDAGST
jgi:putative ubiquitin-RnfH superfamily antitoxin RatB of RatAB toxin-antitoxin module